MSSYTLPSSTMPLRESVVITAMAYKSTLITTEAEVFRSPMAVISANHGMIADGYPVIFPKYAYGMYSAHPNKLLTVRMKSILNRKDSWLIGDLTKEAVLP